MRDLHTHTGGDTEIEKCLSVLVEWFESEWFITDQSDFFMVKLLHMLRLHTLMSLV